MKHDHLLETRWEFVVSLTTAVLLNQFHPCLKNKPHWVTFCKTARQSHNYQQRRRIASKHDSPPNPYLLTSSKHLPILATKCPELRVRTHIIIHMDAQLENKTQEMVPTARVQTVKQETNKAWGKTKIRECVKPQELLWRRVFGETTGGDRPSVRGLSLQQEEMKDCMSFCLGAANAILWARMDGWEEEERAKYFWVQIWWERLNFGR